MLLEIHGVFLGEFSAIELVSSRHNGFSRLGRPRRGGSRIRPSDFMASVTATLVQSEEAGSLVLAAAGEWLVATAADIDRRLRAIQVPKDRRVPLDLTGIERLDTAGAWLLLRTEHDLAERGNAVEMRNLRPNFEPLIDQVRAADIAPARHPRPGYHTIAGFIAGSGRFRSGWSAAPTASSASSALRTTALGWRFIRAGSA